MQEQTHSQPVQASEPPVSFNDDWDQDIRLHQITAASKKHITSSTLGEYVHIRAKIARAGQRPFLAEGYLVAPHKQYEHELWQDMTLRTLAKIRDSHHYVYRTHFGYKHEGQPASRPALFLTKQTPEQWYQTASSDAWLADLKAKVQRAGSMTKKKNAVAMHLRRNYLISSAMCYEHNADGSSVKILALSHPLHVGEIAEEPQEISSHVIRAAMEYTVDLASGDVTCARKVFKLPRRRERQLHDGQMHHMTDAEFAVYEQRFTVDGIPEEQLADPEVLARQTALAKAAAMDEALNSPRSITNFANQRAVDWPDASEVKTLLVRTVADSPFDLKASVPLNMQHKPSSHTTADEQTPEAYTVKGILMDYLPGRDLVDWLNELSQTGQINWAIYVQVIDAALKALPEDAVHGDLQPWNVRVLDSSYDQTTGQHTLNLLWFDPMGGKAGQIIQMPLNMHGLTSAPIEVNDAYSSNAETMTLHPSYDVYSYAVMLLKMEASLPHPERPPFSAEERAERESLYQEMLGLIESDPHKCVVVDGTLHYTTHGEEIAGNIKRACLHAPLGFLRTVKECLKPVEERMEMNDLRQILASWQQESAALESANTAEWGDATYALLQRTPACLAPVAAVADETVAVEAAKVEEVPEEEVDAEQPVPEVQTPDSPAGHEAEEEAETKADEEEVAEEVQADLAEQQPQTQPEEASTTVKQGTKRPASISTTTYDQIMRRQAAPDQEDQPGDDDDKENTSVKRLQLAEPVQSKRKRVVEGQTVLQNWFTPTPVHGTSTAETPRPSGASVRQVR